jgi:hypothetical protein
VAREARDSRALTPPISSFPVVRAAIMQERLLSYFSQRLLDKKMSQDIAKLRQS